MQQVLETWTTIARSALRISPKPVPWMIFYDEQRAWHLNADMSVLPAAATESATTVSADGQSYVLHVVAHDRAVWTPAAEPLRVGAGAEPRIVSMPYGVGQKSFTAIALPTLLRRVAGANTTRNWESFLIGVAGHELVHTRQLGDVVRRVRVLRERHPLPQGITDNYIQQTFVSNPQYVTVYSKERDLLFQAAFELETNRALSLRLISEALVTADMRRATFFKDDRTGYRDIDDIFLGMEGIAMWTQFQIARAQAPKDVSWQTSAVELLKGNTDWVQEEGFVLFVLIDHLVPNWQPLFLAPDFPAPFAVLREAVERATRRGA